MSTQTVWVRNASIKDYDGEITNLELGQIFTMRNCLHDEKLLAHHYLEPLTPSSESGISECLPCGRKFVNDGYRNEHARKAQHPALDLDTGPLKEAPKPVAVAASGPDRDLEPVGAPAPTRAEESGMAAEMAVRSGASPSRTRGAGAKASEVFRL